MHATARAATVLACCLISGTAHAVSASGVVTAGAPVKNSDLPGRLLTVQEAQSITGFTGTLVEGKATSTKTAWAQPFTDQASGRQKFGAGIWIYPRLKAQTAAQLLATADSLMPGSVAGMQCQVYEKVPPKVTKACWNDTVIYAVSVRKFGTTGVSGTSVQYLGTIPDPARPSQTLDLTATDALKEKVATDAQWLRDDQKQKALTGSV